MYILFCAWQILKTSYLQCTLCFVSFLIIFGHRVSLCSSGCSRTYSVEQTGLEPRGQSVSASQVLGLKACFITAWLCAIFKAGINSFIHSSYVQDIIKIFCLGQKIVLSPWS